MRNARDSALVCDVMIGPHAISLPMPYLMENWITIVFRYVPNVRASDAAVFAAAAASFPARNPGPSPAYCDDQEDHIAMGSGQRA